MTQEDEDWLLYSVSILSTLFIFLFICIHAISAIFRMPNPLWRTTKNAAVEVYKKPIQLSYIFKLQDISQSNCVAFHLKTSRPAEVKLLWAVSVSYLFELMRCPWSHFQTAIKEEYLANYTEVCHSVVDCPLEQSTDGVFDNVISIKPPSNLNWIDLKNRYRYPLAIIIYNPVVMTETTVDSAQSGGNEIHGLFVILHVKSDPFPMPTAVLSSYIKMDSGNTFLLKPLYLVEEGENEEQVSPVSELQPELSNPLDNSPVDSFPNVSCCVCQTLPVSRAILPCGHVSLCSQCFQKVDKCPICRGEMQFYFRTRDEDYHEDETPDPPRPRTWFDILDEWNERINNWFGLYG